MKIWVGQHPHGFLQRLWFAAPLPPHGFLNPPRSALAKIAGRYSPGSKRCGDWVPFAHAAVHPGWTLPPLMLQSHSNLKGRDLCYCQCLCTGTQPTPSAEWETCHQHAGMTKAPAALCPSDSHPGRSQSTARNWLWPQGNIPFCRYKRKAGFGCVTLTLHSHHPFPRVGAQLHSMPGKANIGGKNSGAPEPLHPTEKPSQTLQPFLSLETTPCPKEP